MDLPTELLSNQHCQTGENTYFNPDDGRLYWADIPAGLIYRYDFATRATDVCYRGEQVGGFTLQADGKLLLFRVQDIATLALHTGEVEVIVALEDHSMTRFNDACADPLGRVFMGTMSKTGTAGLYRIGLDGVVDKLFGGTNTANGMGFSPDESTFYWTDTTNKRIDRFAYDRERGTIRDRSVFHVADDGHGSPDGMAVDANGNVWSARYGGGRVVMIDPAGKLVDEVVIPTPAVTCPAFGGADGRDLFVTTAEGKPGDASEAGATYRVRTSVAGRERFRSRVKL